VNGAEIHSLYRRVRDRAFTLGVRSSFASLGPHTRLSLPVQLEGTRRIAVGRHVYLGPGCWLLTHGPAGHLAIGDGTSIAGYCVLSAAADVRIGRKVLLARNVYIADHRHGFERVDLPVLDQEIADVRPILVEDGAWLGQNVVVLPGVTIGRGAVVGAGSVVREDIPPRCIAVGAPARVVRELDDADDAARRLADDAARLFPLAS
jgi:acetyltransferase-like isoleucine patch superfamily enzyme